MRSIYAFELRLIESIFFFQSYFGRFVQWKERQISYEQECCLCLLSWVICELEYLKEN